MLVLYRLFNFSWVKIGVVTDLFCYPVKSCAPVKVQEINCENIGFRNGLLRDRVFIVVNSETGRLITGHRYPELVLINPKVEDKALILAGSGMSELKVDIDKAMKYVSWKKVEVSGTALDVIDCGEEAAEWLSQFIFKNNHGLRLFYYPSSRPMKPVDPKDRKRWPSTTSPKHTGATHDMTSYMIMNLASVEELNKRLDEPVSPLQFRPNIVFTGLPAFDEDQIRWFKIGEHAVFKFVQPCLRCSFTTVSPETGQKHPSAEPLQTLKS